MNGLINRIFYITKPLIPRRVQIALRRRIGAYKRRKCAHIWPIDPNSATPPAGWPGWPEGKDFALVLSHDVDTRKGYDNVLMLADLEEKMGFRSCFNFVPKRYGDISLDLLDELRRRGFGVGVHGLKHDGRLFLSQRIFDRRAVRINEYLHEWQTSGFSSPSMHRNLDWMGALNITYSISTFDTDPFEPQPDGVGTIFPFLVPRKSVQPAPCSVHDPSPLTFSTSNPLGREGSSALTFSTSNLLSASGEASSPLTFSTSNLLNFFVELPYTLPQDSTLFIILQEQTIDIWKRKLDWIAEKGGMALINTHADYMKFSNQMEDLGTYPIDLYIEFLNYVKTKYRDRCWYAQPIEVARFVKANRFI